MFSEQVPRDRAHPSRARIQIGARCAPVGKARPPERCRSTSRRPIRLLATTESLAGVLKRSYGPEPTNSKEARLHERDHLQAAGQGATAHPSITAAGTTAIEQGQGARL